MNTTLHKETPRAIGRIAYTQPGIIDFVSYDGIAICAYEFDDGVVVYVDNDGDVFLVTGGKLCVEHITAVKKATKQDVLQWSPLLKEDDDDDLIIG